MAVQPHGEGKDATQETPTSPAHAHQPKQTRRPPALQVQPQQPPQQQAAVSPQPQRSHARSFLESLLLHQRIAQHAQSQVVSPRAKLLSAVAPASPNLAPTLSASLALPSQHRASSSVGSVGSTSSSLGSAGGSAAAPAPPPGMIASWGQSAAAATQAHHADSSGGNQATTSGVILPSSPLAAASAPFSSLASADSTSSTRAAAAAAAATHRSASTLSVNSYRPQKPSSLASEATSTTSTSGDSDRSSEGEGDEVGERDEGRGRQERLRGEHQDPVPGAIPVAAADEGVARDSGAAARTRTPGLPSGTAASSSSSSSRSASSSSHSPLAFHPGAAAGAAAAAAAAAERSELPDDVESKTASALPVPAAPRLSRAQISNEVIPRILGLLKRPGQAAQPSVEWDATTTTTTTTTPTSANLRADDERETAATRPLVGQGAVVVDDEDEVEDDDDEEERVEQVRNLLGDTLSAVEGVDPSPSRLDGLVLDLLHRHREDENPTGITFFAPPLSAGLLGATTRRPSSVRSLSSSSSTAPTTLLQPNRAPGSPWHPSPLANQPPSAGEPRNSDEAAGFSTGVAGAALHKHSASSSRSSLAGAVGAPFDGSGSPTPQHSTILPSPPAPPPLAIQIGHHTRGDDLPLGNDGSAAAAAGALIGAAPPAQDSRPSSAMSVVAATAFLPPLSPSSPVPAQFNLGAIGQGSPRASPRLWNRIAGGNGSNPALVGSPAASAAAAAAAAAAAVAAAGAFSSAASSSSSSAADANPRSLGAETTASSRSGGGGGGAGSHVGGGNPRSWSSDASSLAATASSPHGSHAAPAAAAVGAGPKSHSPERQVGPSNAAVGRSGARLSVAATEFRPRSSASAQTAKSTVWTGAGGTAGASGGGASAAAAAAATTPSNLTRTSTSALARSLASASLAAASHASAEAARSGTSSATSGGTTRRTGLGRFRSFGGGVGEPSSLDDDHARVGHAMGHGEDGEGGQGEGGDSGGSSSSASDEHDEFSPFASASNSRRSSKATGGARGGGGGGGDEGGLALMGGIMGGGGGGGSRTSSFTAAYGRPHLAIGGAAGMSHLKYMVPPAGAPGSAEALEPGSWGSMSPSVTGSVPFGSGGAGSYDVGDEAMATWMVGHEDMANAAAAGVGVGVGAATTTMSMTPFDVLQSILNSAPSADDASTSGPTSARAPGAGGKPARHHWTAEQIEGALAMYNWDIDATLAAIVANGGYPPTGAGAARSALPPSGPRATMGGGAGENGGSGGGGGGGGNNNSNPASPTVVPRHPKAFAGTTATDAGPGRAGVSILSRETFQSYRSASMAVPLQPTAPGSTASSAASAAVGGGATRGSSPMAWPTLAAAGQMRFGSSPKISSVAAAAGAAAASPSGSSAGVAGVASPVGSPSLSGPAGLLAGGGGGGVGTGVSAGSSVAAAAHAGRVCRYFLAGECRRSDCRFSHDLGRALCRFWLRGQCLNNPCSFLHDIDVVQALATGATSSATNTMSSTSAGSSSDAPSATEPDTPPNEDFPELNAPSAPKAQRGVGAGVGGRATSSAPDPSRNRWAAALQKKPAQTPLSLVQQGESVVSIHGRGAPSKPVPAGPRSGGQGSTTTTAASGAARAGAAAAGAVVARIPLRPPTLLPTLSTGREASSTYNSLRSQALSLSEERNRLLVRAGEAYRRGDATEARRWSAKAQSINAQLADEGRAAAAAVLRQRHAELRERLFGAGAQGGGWGSGQTASDEAGARGLRGKPMGAGLGLCLGVASAASVAASSSLSVEERAECFLDLHALHAHEAVEAAEEFLLGLEREGYRGLAYLGVGKGSHTSNSTERRRVRLAVAVRQFLASWQYAFAEQDGIAIVDPLSHG